MTAGCASSSVAQTCTNNKLTTLDRLVRNLSALTLRWLWYYWLSARARRWSCSDMEICSSWSVTRRGGFVVLGLVWNEMGLVWDSWWESQNGKQSGNCSSSSQKGKQEGNCGFSFPIGRQNMKRKRNDMAFQLQTYDLTDYIPISSLNSAMKYLDVLNI